MGDKIMVQCSCFKCPKHPAYGAELPPTYLLAKMFDGSECFIPMILVNAEVHSDGSVSLDNGQDVEDRRIVCAFAVGRG